MQELHFCLELLLDCETCEYYPCLSITGVPNTEPLNDVLYFSSELRLRTELQEGATHTKPCSLCV